ncbi:hypothetical protein PIB30_092933 [Stylosanthes scabra]|uniref:Uncharacterized protein n=1 Tax=Stylosanthes scabra TaxID=79078 RepID=A0ABU6RVJ7_9FABA|nr:hypothetical protein [Stylosanthes scabra]
MSRVCLDPSWEPLFIGMLRRERIGHAPKFKQLAPEKQHQIHAMGYRWTKGGTIRVISNPRIQIEFRWESCISTEKMATNTGIRPVNLWAMLYTSATMGKKDRMFDANATQELCTIALLLCIRVARSATVITVLWASLASVFSDRIA